jgi:hypothetical protein
MAVDPREQALAYLREQLGPAAPATLEALGHFAESPLDGEGPVTLYRFVAAVGGAEPATYVVAAGETEPNYYPAYDLTPDEAYHLHLGTRFMLVVGVGQVPASDVPPGEVERLSALVRGVVPDRTVSELTLVTAFRVEDGRHLVARAAIDGHEVYLLGGDLPLGLYERTALPPQVVYRMHLGQVLRMEPSEDEPGEEEQQ